MLSEMQERQAEVVSQSESLLIKGNLSVHNVMRLYDSSLSYLQNHSHLQFDFADVAASDSAGLALMLAWINYAKQNHKSLQFKHIPSTIISLVQVARLDQLFAIDNDKNITLAV